MPAWRLLYADPERHWRGDPGGRAALRRAATPEAVMVVPAFHDILIAVRQSGVDLPARADANLYRWLALAIVGYGINHLITAVLHLTGPAVFVLMVGLASICQMSFLVGFRLLAGISPESGPGEARRLFAVGSVVVALAILLTFRIAPVLVHVVSSVIVAYTAALHWRLCRAQPDQGYGLIALLMLSHPVVLCVLVLMGVAPVVVRDVVAFVYVAIGYSVVSATLSRASSELTRAT